MDLIEDLINLWYHCIAASVGFCFVFASGARELRILGLYSEGEWLSEVIPASPAW
jgi:hypothetical protein